MVCPEVAPPATSVSTSEHNFLLGPRASFSIGKFRPFVHALIGAGHISESASGLSNSSTSFADALGGGLDYHLIPPISWRIQADAMQARFFGSTQNNVRISTGIVIHFWECGTNLGSDGELRVCYADNALTGAKVGQPPADLENCAT